MGETFYRLQNCMRAVNGNDQFSISPHKYRNTGFIIGQSFEKAGGQASHTGVNTMSGAQLTINVKNANDAKRMHVVLLYDAVADVSAAGVRVLA